ncbi:MAG: hypothetical protein FJZ43_00460 [Candidatus Staskawiczbacteria bacterium]|nr:hypothetical protein [Candidatus Staskawiczbacteria bacterium]
MLELLKLGDSGLRQKLLFGKEVVKYSRATNMTRKHVVSDEYGTVELTLYQRSNACNKEAGIILLPPKDFGHIELIAKMIRVFGQRMENCFATVGDYYFYLVAKYGLTKVKYSAWNPE